MKPKCRTQLYITLAVYLEVTVCITVQRMRPNVFMFYDCSVAAICQTKQVVFIIMHVQQTNSRVTIVKQIINVLHMSFLIVE